jgi:hypothetical protein
MRRTSGEAVCLLGIDEIQNFFQDQDTRIQTKIALIAAHKIKLLGMNGTIRDVHNPRIRVQMLISDEKTIMSCPVWSALAAFVQRRRTNGWLYFNRT